MPNKIKGPPINEALGILSEKKKKANTEAIIGSPSGTEATAVGERCFNECVKRLCPRIDGNIASAKNQIICSSLKSRGFVPKRKQTPSRTGMRRAQNMRFSTKNIVEDKKSGEYRLSHHLDLKTGMYKGRQVLDPKE